MPLCCDSVWCGARRGALLGGNFRQVDSRARHAVRVNEVNHHAVNTDLPVKVMFYLLEVCEERDGARELLQLWPLHRREAVVPQRSSERIVSERGERERPQTADAAA
eukprot:scaffold134574_cov31-Tisochrysis_lutea.AAC.2